MADNYIILKINYIFIKTFITMIQIVLIILLILFNYINICILEFYDEVLIFVFVGRVLKTPLLYLIIIEEISGDHIGQIV